uniref:Probable DNA polymerase n=1 Tax=Arthromyces claviformis TaxID=530043 RepID=A0A8F1D624_9AGAR|nr:DNA polymerase [Arthromyces claviformis]
MKTEISKGILVISFLYYFFSFYIGSRFKQYDIFIKNKTKSMKTINLKLKIESFPNLNQSYPYSYPYPIIRATQAANANKKSLRLFLPQLNHPFNLRKGFSSLASNSKLTPISHPPKLIINKWNNFFFNLGTETVSASQLPLAGLVTEQKIIIALEKFKEELFSELSRPSSEYIDYKEDYSCYRLLIIFKIQTTNNQIRSISYLQNVNLKEFDLLKKIFLEFWDLKTEEYFLVEVSHIIYSFKLVPLREMQSTPSSSQNIRTFSFENVKDNVGTLERLETPVIESKLLISDYSALPNKNDNLTDTSTEIPKTETNILSTNSIIKNSIINSKSSRMNRTSFGGVNLPNTMDILLWGDVHFISETQAIVYRKQSYSEYHVELFNDYLLAELKIDDKIILKFKDTLNDKINLSTFTRTIKNHEYIYQEGNLLLKKIKKKVRFLTKILPNMHQSKKILTMDLETRTINGVMTSYCVSIYDGKTSKSFYLSDFNSETEMLRKSILYLMKRKYNNYRVYLHNFSGFDAVFLLRIMSDLSDNLKPTMRKGKFLDLRFNFADKYTLFFRDSLLILPGTLRSLAKNFNVVEKSIFPYNFVNNPKIELTYSGLVPEYKYFDGITLDEYKAYSANFYKKDWNLKDETIKYCELDCIVLFKIIDKFSDNIFKLFRIDILKYPTLSSLAFAIFRSRFLKEEDRIPLIHGEIYNFIKKSYTGGSVDVYKPTPVISKEENPENKSDSKEDKMNLIPNKTKKIKRYDVNSLYPFTMKNFPMPTGCPIYFEGDILSIWNKHRAENILKSRTGDSNYQEKKPFGIFEVNIETPLDIKIPLLQTKVKLKNGTTRTIAPIGNWTGQYFSDELYNAEKYGYKFTVIRGYLFERGNIFTSYVDFLYEMKKYSEKGTPNYIISKLLLNSLYGRLGMSPIPENHLVISNKQANEFYSKYNITNVVDLKNGKELISFLDFDQQSQNNDIEHIDVENYKNKNISVVVSSVVTASARIHMSQFKTNNSYTLYYTDTDSIDIDGELDSKFIGNELGQMKLEHTFNDAVFLSPKMYGGITDSYEYLRIRGLKNPLKFNELKGLLTKGTKLESKQEKWYSDISNGKFNIKDEIFTLMVTDNKRKLLYDKDNKFYNTLPLKIENGEIIE